MQVRPRNDVHDVIVSSRWMGIGQEPWSSLCEHSATAIADHFGIITSQRRAGETFVDERLGPRLGGPVECFGNFVATDFSLG
jgi:hypothetical protein